jgi:mevalonate kinase
VFSSFLPSPLFLLLLPSHRPLLLFSLRRRLPLSLKIESEVPVGAGLGSSAAYSVSLAGALLALNPKSRGLLRPSPTTEGLELVNWWALEAERIMHGDGASGIDNTVSTYGGALLYTKGTAPIQLRKLVISSLHSRVFSHFEHNTTSIFIRMPALHTLIINTRVSRDTKALVEGVHQRRTKVSTESF